MTYNKFGITNNAICLLSLEIDESSMILTGVGNYNRFPTANFIVTLTQRDTDGAIVAMENMLITSRTGAVFTVGTRAYEEVPIDDDATSNIQQALPFDPLVTTIEATVSAKFLTDIQDEVEDIRDVALPLKVDLTTYNAEKQVFAASSAGDDDYEITSATVTTYVNGQTFKIQADVPNNGPATLKLNALAAKALEKIDGGAFTALETGDIIANQIFWATYNSVEDCFQFSVDPANVAVTVPDSDTTQRGIIEQATDPEALLFADTLRAINAYQLGLATAAVEQDIPFAVGAVTQNASGVRIQTSLDGSVMGLVFPNAASTQLTVMRLARENNSNNYVITHRTTITPVSGVDNPWVCPIGSYIYVGYSDGGTKTCKRYDIADLANVTAITISGTNWTAWGNAFTDGTNLYVFHANPDDVAKYTISGTTITYDSTKTYTSAGNMNTAGSVCSDGTSVWAVGAQANATVIRKYALAGGAASSSTTRYLYYDAYINYSPIRLFIPKKWVLGLAYGKSTFDQTNHLGSSLKIQSTIQP